MCLCRGGSGVNVGCVYVGGGVGLMWGVFMSGGSGVNVGCVYVGGSWVNVGCVYVGGELD